MTLVSSEGGMHAEMARKSKRTDSSCKNVKKRKKVVRTHFKTNVADLVKNRLTRITNLIHKHIYNAKKRLSAHDAQNYLQELDSMKIHCVSNVRYLQVHEKLSTQMSSIMMGNDQLGISGKEVGMEMEEQCLENKCDEVLSTKTVIEVCQEQCVLELRSTQTTPSDIFNMDNIIDLTGNVSITSLNDIETDKPFTNIPSAKDQISVLKNATDDSNGNIIFNMDNIIDLTGDVSITSLNDIETDKSFTNIPSAKDQISVLKNATDDSNGNIIFNMDNIIDLTGDVSITSLNDIETDKSFTNIPSAKDQISVLMNAPDDSNRNNNIETSNTELNYDEKRFLTKPTTCTSGGFKTFICNDHNCFTNTSLTQSRDRAIDTNDPIRNTSKESINAEHILNSMINLNNSTPEIHQYDSSYPIYENDIVNRLQNSNDNPLTSMILDMEESIVSEDNLQICTTNNNSHFTLHSPHPNINNVLPMIKLNNEVKETSLNSEIKNNGPTECTKQSLESKNEIANLFVYESEQNKDSATRNIENTCFNYNIETTNPITSLIAEFEALETVNSASDSQHGQLSENSPVYVDNNTYQVTLNESNEKDCNVLNSNRSIKICLSEKLVDYRVTGPDCDGNREHDIATDENIYNSDYAVNGVILTVNDHTSNDTENTSTFSSEFDWFKGLKFIRDINDSEYFSNAVLPEGFWSNESLPKEWEADFDIWD